MSRRRRGDDPAHERRRRPLAQRPELDLRRLAGRVVRGPGLRVGGRRQRRDGGGDLRRRALLGVRQRGLPGPAAGGQVRRREPRMGVGLRHQRDPRDERRRRELAETHDAGDTLVLRSGLRRPEHGVGRRRRRVDRRHHRRRRELGRPGVDHDPAAERRRFHRLTERLGGRQRGPPAHDRRRHELARRHLHERLLRGGDLRQRRSRLGRHPRRLGVRHHRRRRPLGQAHDDVDQLRAARGRLLERIPRLGHRRPRHDHREHRRWRALAHPGRPRRHRQLRRHRLRGRSPRPRGGDQRSCARSTAACTGRPACCPDRSRG